MTELQPDAGEVLQEESKAHVTVPVCLADQTQPLRTQALPRKGGATFTKTLTTTPQRVLTADPRRSGFTLSTTDTANSYRIAFTETAAQDVTTMAVWPGMHPYVGDMRTEVWVAAVAGTFDLGVTTSLWAEGG